MKNIYYCVVLVMLMFSSCSMMTTNYSMSKGKIDIPQKATYHVVYQAKFDPLLTADIAYTDENGKQAELKKLSGNWEKAVTLKSGTHVEFKTFAKANEKSKGEYKILVDGKIVSEYILSGKRLDYMIAFDLP